MDSRITLEVLKEAFRKLLSATYYDKTDLVIRYHVASFVKRLQSEGEDRIFNELLRVAQGKDSPRLEKWLEKISLALYPKSMDRSSGNGAAKDKHIITNSPLKDIMVSRLLVKADIPVELRILDVAWLILYGYNVDGKLYKQSYGNRLELKASGGVLKGNALFKKYQTQYRNWWGDGIKIANEHLKGGEDISIINFDISNCYHSIDFSFEKFFTYYASSWPEDKMPEDPLTTVIVRIYQQYWSIVHSSDEEVFRGKNQGKSPMPVSLMSAHLFANWYLSPLDKFICDQLNPLYYGRYVDDCMVVVKTHSAGDLLAECIEQELPGLMSFDGDRVSFSLNTADDETKRRMSVFDLQQDKLFLYRFDCTLSQTTLDSFVQEQQERSSEYRFLTDDMDTGRVNLENITLINTLDAEEEPGRRFNILEENKYKLAVYLAKLSSRLAHYGKEYERFDEVDKVKKYFTGSLLIKHYQLWERLLSVFVLAGRKEYAKDFYDKALMQIQALEVKESVFKDDPAAGCECVKKCLCFHLEQSLLMAFSLHRESDEISTLYLDTFLSRMHFNSLPLQEFSTAFSTKGVRLTINELKLNTELFKYRWIPYYVKYYAIVSALSLGKEYNPGVFARAFNYFRCLNHVGDLYEWMVFCRPPKDEDDPVTEFNTDLERSHQYPNSRTVSVVEMDFEAQAAIEAAKAFGEISHDKVKLFERVLDQISMIPNTDVFVLPELSLPICLLMDYCRYSSKHEKAFVAGMEYFVNKKVVYNYTITCLPITLYGQKDAVPVIRLKNYYSPKEIEEIKATKLKVPKNSRKWQNLYHWHGHVFTTYYCYELTSILARSFFFSKVDAIYCPLFNKDTYYFNNIAESMVRDMHCYFILSNVSHYGDSRVSEPTSHIGMNLVKVKGGNTEDNKAVVLSATIDIERLRSFQKMAVNEQTNMREKKETNLKNTPPDYDSEMVVLREKERFLYDRKRKIDKMFERLMELQMEYKAK